MRDFATTDPRTAGRSGAVGSTCIYVTGGVGTPLYKFGAGDTDWCTPSELGGAEVVTSDPRSGAGLARDVGARVLYVTGGVGLLLYKFSATVTDWCSITFVPVASVTGLTSALAAKDPLISPAFTTNPTAPTAAPGTNTTQLATTAFVTAAGAVVGTSAHAVVWLFGGS